MKMWRESLVNTLKEDDAMQREYKDIEESITQIKSNLDRINTEFDKHEWSKMHLNKISGIPLIEEIVII